MTRGQRTGVEDRWHRSARKGEQVPYPADAPDTTGGVWCMDPRHGTPGTGKMVCSVRHGTGKRWLARWVDADGETRSLSYDRKSNAQARANQVTADMVTYTYVDTRKSSVTFRTVADEWMTTQRNRLKPSTIGGYESLLQMTVLPRWGDVKLSDITHADVQAWVDWMTTDKEARQPRSNSKVRNDARKPLSPRRAVQAHGILRQILDRAAKTRRIAVNPAVGVELPRVIHRRDTALTHAQVAALVNAAGDAGPILLTLAYTGCRFGELAALRVGDVDLSAKRISIDKGVAQVNKVGLVEDTTKTHQIRKVPMLTTQLVDVLTAVTAGRKSTDYLFPAPDGGPLRNSYVDWRFDKACESTGLTGISLKTLRHTAGSLAIRDGGFSPAVSKMLGHAKVSTTLDVYAHMFGDDFDELAAAVDKGARSAVKDPSPRLP